MRLIDADALEELFREVIGGIAKKPEMNGNLEHMVRASAMVIEMIKDAPTIEPKQADDLISRADAIEATWQEPTYTDPLNVLTEVRDRIEAVPSAQPKQGKWIFEHDETAPVFLRTRWRCSECGDWQTYGKTKFCPNCGAKMEVANADTNQHTR